MARSDAAVDVNNLVDGWLLLEECWDEEMSGVLRHSVSGEAVRSIASVPMSKTNHGS